VAIQVAQQKQLQTGRILTDALGRMFEYNLIPFPPTLQNRLGSTFAKSAGSTETRERGKEA
jgi:hypothetical protein